jgi:hypothetical protein
VPGGNRHGGRQAQHVDGSPAPDFAIDELTAEGVVAPTGGVHWDYIGVPHQHEARGCGIPPFKSGHETSTARERFIGLYVEACSVQIRSEEIRAARLTS